MAVAARLERPAMETMGVASVRQSAALAQEVQQEA
jgi:hypothetical protein